MRLAAFALILLTVSAGPAEADVRVNNIIQVSSKPGSGCPALRDVLDDIDDASSSNPYLIRLEPGEFQCGSTTLVVPAFVTIEGSGRRLTTISGTINNIFLGVVHLLDGEIRELTVENTGAGSSGRIAVSVWTLVAEPVSGSMTDVIVSAGGSGLYASGANVAVSLSTVSSSCLEAGAAVRFAYSSVGAIDLSGGATAKCRYSVGALDQPLDVNCM